MATRVAFVIDHKGSLTALFPYVIADTQGKFKMCYAHIGQHGAYSDSWAQHTSNARPDEYAKLHKELVSIGYDDLIVLDYWGDTFPSCVRLYPFGGKK